MAGTKVVAVCDILPERADAAAKAVEMAGGSAAVYTDFRKMLEERKDIDAVLVATPDWTHRDVDIAVLEMGKHLYAEKPLALNIADCKMIRSTAKQAKGIMQVGFQLRHDANRLAAEKFIHSGGIGKVLMCHGIRHGGDLPRDIPWYFDKNKGGDIVVDQGIHILDLFNWAIGTHPLRAHGLPAASICLLTIPPGRTVMDNYSLIFEYPNGVRVNFSHHYFDPPGFSRRSGARVRRRRRRGSGGRHLAAAREAGSGQTRCAGRGRGLHLQRAEGVWPATRATTKSPSTTSTPRSNRRPWWIMATKAIYEKRIVTWDEVVGS